LLVIALIVSEPELSNATELAETVTPVSTVTFEPSPLTSRLVQLEEIVTVFPLTAVQSAA